MGISSFLKVGCVRIKTNIPIENKALMKFAGMW